MTAESRNLIVVGRDARVSGPMVRSLVCATLTSLGFDVADIGLASTPTTEVAVKGLKAAGGIILTASHNPAQWNALKLLNADGEFLNDPQGKEVLALADDGDFDFVTYDRLGNVLSDQTWNMRHIDMVLNLDLVDREAIAKANFTVAVDAVNSVGGIVIPQLLRALGVKNIIELNCEATGRFGCRPSGHRH